MISSGRKIFALLLILSILNWPSILHAQSYVFRILEGQKVNSLLVENARNVHALSIANGSCIYLLDDTVLLGNDTVHSQVFNLMDIHQSTKVFNFEGQLKTISLVSGAASRICISSDTTDAYIENMLIGKLELKDNGQDERHIENNEIKGLYIGNTHINWLRLTSVSFSDDVPHTEPRIYFGISVIDSITLENIEPI